MSISGFSSSGGYCRISKDTHIYFFIYLYTVSIDSLTVNRRISMSLTLLSNYSPQSSQMLMYFTAHGVIGETFTEVGKPRVHDGDSKGV